MIKAICDNCQKDLGEVSLEIDEEDARYIISPYRNFAIGYYAKTDKFVVACSTECASILSTKHGKGMTERSLPALKQRFGEQA